MKQITDNMSRDNDIVEQLRNASIYYGQPNLYDEAADKIERLTHERDRLRDVLIWTEQNCPGKCAAVARAALEKAHD